MLPLGFILLLVSNIISGICSNHAQNVDSYVEPSAGRDDGVKCNPSSQPILSMDPLPLTSTMQCTCGGGFSFDGASAAIQLSMGSSYRPMILLPGPLMILVGSFNIL